MAESVRKKSKGAAVCSTSYDEGWEHLYPDGPVNGNKNPFFCIPCQKTMSYAHQGIGGVKQHDGGKAYKRMVKTLKENHKINYQKKTSSISDVQIRAKVLDTDFIVQHIYLF